MKRSYENITDKVIEYEGKRWSVTMKAFYRGNSGQLRVYKIHGDVNDPDLQTALQLEADTIGLSFSIWLET